MGNERVRIKKSKAAMYRTIRHNKPAVFAILIIVLLLLVVISVDGKSLSEKNKSLLEQKSVLEEQLKQEAQRTKDLEEFEKYTKTKKYAEEMAKKKLGLVHENEIIFRTDDGK